MEHTVTTKKWYVVTGTAGATVTSPDGKKTYCTIPEGGQGTFYATTSKVVTSDDSVEVVETTFNSAPVKLRLLGLLGGGASTGLPAGYLAAEFLESTGTQYIDTGYVPDAGSGMRFDGISTIPGDFIPMGCRNAGNTDTRYYIVRKGYSVTSGFGWGEWSGIQFEGAGNPGRWVGSLNWLNSRTATISPPLRTFSLWTLSFIPTGEVFIYAANIGGKPSLFWSGRVYAAGISKGSEVVRDYVPFLDKNGVPCMFDKVTKQTFYNSGTGQFIVGMTLEQARKLGKLPSTGGSLTVSLPSNYAEDEGVVNALAKAQENGWKITIQTYEAEAGAASTFALRRVWVRKRADEQGSYVDADGFRWQVEWCVDVVGSSPEAEGYEPFRSVDVSVNYWNLQPWFDPEQEELLTNIEEQ